MEIQKPGKNWTHTVFRCGLQTILLSPKFHCTEEILTIVALLSVDSILYNPPSRRDEVQSVRKKFVSSEGDHLTLLNVYRTFKNTGGNKVGPVLFLFSHRASLWSYVSGHLPFLTAPSEEPHRTLDVIPETSAPEMLQGKTQLQPFSLLVFPSYLTWAGEVLIPGDPISWLPDGLFPHLPLTFFIAAFACVTFPFPGPRWKTAIPSFIYQYNFKNK